MTVIEMRTMNILCSNLPRIATALERIANALDHSKEPTSDTGTGVGPHIGVAEVEHTDATAGRSDPRPSAGIR